MITDYAQLSREELLAELRARDDTADRTVLIHDLEVHQVELETQNHQLRETQRLLEESRTRYADLYDFAPVAYCTLDKNGCIKEINLSGARLLGVDRNQLIGKPLTVYIATKDRQALARHLDDCFNHGASATMELVLAPRGKETVTLQLTSAPARDFSGKINACLAALTDVSPRKRGEESLRRSVRMRQDFLAVVSHDLRNPLNSVLLCVELLRRPIPGNDRRKFGLKHLETIRRAARRMNSLVSDLLDLSSMEAGHLSLNRDAHDVSTLIDAALESVRPSATQRNVRLEMHVARDGLGVLADRDRVTQVLINLLGNAIKFAGGGAIRVEAKPGRDDVEVSVHDTGIGMTAEQLARVFEPYWQAENAPRVGAGLGLSIAKGIAESHGGRIWIESQLHKGTTVLFTLPSASSTHETSSLPDYEPSPTPSRPTSLLPPKVLVVDDEADIRDALAEVLTTAGYDVATAGDGQEALDTLRHDESVPSLILLDLTMPVMSGWKFLKERSRDPRLAEVPVILISAQVDVQSVAASERLTGFVEKPVGIATLFQAIEQHVRLGAVASPEAGRI